ncbi:PepSY domain-containing protein [Rhodobacteraceae bacterium N5(2021)]|uniref:PepSY domain-containing protein n=1 Tax=Gymnodinialimonas phycosphaerae TaxID=2841589 RepID=A0A975YE73_9RHOB|nr:PepSY domain-containing protein [Gymnodinialimonas phycosphaerae]MBY4893332.1 PepSY domain-containing protein [Gymnodinialimonas phycosphaerae]
MKHFALILILLTVPAWADDDDQDRARRALEAGEILPLADILEVAQAARSGRVIELDLERDDGRWIYDLELITPGGYLYEMEIDGATGTILEIEREDD